MSQYEDLYTAFTTHLEQFGRHRGFIDKANALSDDFRAEVIKVVVDDHTERSMTVVSEIMSVLFEVESAVEALQTERAGVEAGAVESRSALEELELNLMIEAIDQAEFDDQAAALKTALGDTDNAIAALDLELEGFQTALEKWNVLGKSSGVLQ